MIKTWLIRGDTHGNMDELINQLVNYERETTAVIVLGDFGINFFLNKTDTHKKEFVEAQKYYIYVVRGNHEMRPEHLSSKIHEYDKNVGGWVVYEPEYPHIRYFDEYASPIYNINGHKTLVIGGAYSVDKWWRLSRAGILDPEMNNPKKTGWFSDEQLTADEMLDIEKYINAENDNHFDFVFTHTCPLKYQPTDLFLGAVDQSTVDTSMEVWLNKISEQITFNVWCFGHYHADRLERPHVEQYFHDIEELDVVFDRWKKYDETGELDWWLNKSPNFYQGV